MLKQALRALPRRLVDARWWFDEPKPQWLELPADRRLTAAERQEAPLRDERDSVAIDAEHAKAARVDARKRKRARGVDWIGGLEGHVDAAPVGASVRLRAEQIRHHDRRRASRKDE
ncbi:MAG: hypothetical protein IT381_32580 [Deltaproteobacteria bacterium]|nr:hypothetical protein [Deltaproteobacteria bacterium]